MITIPCGVAVILKEDKVLISQRNPDDTFGSYWEFPGGKKNHNESFEQCVKRETKEELGVEVRVGAKMMEIKRKHNEKIIWLNFYLCELISGEPQPIDCQNVRWVSLEELESYQFPPANDLVIEKLFQIQEQKKNLS